MTLETRLRIGGVSHLGILFASVLVPKVLDWRNALAGLTPFLRTLFWVYGGFIVLTIVGFGVISIVNAPSLASGTPLARSVCAFIAVFWSARLFVQLFVFDTRGILRGVLMRAGYHVLTAVFVYLAMVYAMAAAI